MISSLHLDDIANEPFDRSRERLRNPWFLITKGKSPRSIRAYTVPIPGNRCAFARAVWMPAFHLYQHSIVGAIDVRDPSKCHSSLFRRFAISIALIICFGLHVIWGSSLRAQQISGGSCPELSQSSGMPFARQVFEQVVLTQCYRCHVESGEASESEMVFQTPRLGFTESQRQVIKQNLDAIEVVARKRESGKSVLLQKVVGDLDHGGGQILKADSQGFRILSRYVASLDEPSSVPSDSKNLGSNDFFRDVERLNHQRLLRKAVLSLAGRLPIESELKQVSEGGDVEIRSVLLNVMGEEAFFDRLREGFNDIFLTQGVDGNPDSTVLSYEHFEKTRLWYQKYDLSHIEDEKERRQEGYRLAREYRAALLEEPMRLIEYIVRHDRPFTEIVTADYIMVSPYTSRGYGVFEEIASRFQDSEDPFEFIPVRLAALRGRQEKENQESQTGFYPHAGLLSTLQYLSRYPTTETNRNRLRARMFFQHFLGIDVLELAARDSDAAAATERYEIPTMQASECVVCHKILDPVAGLFQDYWRFDRNFAIYGKRHEGWFDDMFDAGFNGEGLPAEQRWRALQWLGERTAADDRFAIAMTKHAYRLLTGRVPLSAPTDLEDPRFEMRHRAWREMQCEVERIATAFIQCDYDFKELLIQWVMSPFYRVDGFAMAALDENRMLELDDIGVVRLLSPEQLERKIFAIFGKRWGRLTDQTAILYGGIDSKEVTERATDPSGAMGAIQRTLSNDVACRNVAFDFSRPKAERILFRSIETTTLPNESVESDGQIREVIQHLHWLILGREDAIDGVEVDRTFRLFSEIVADAKAAGDFDSREAWSCRQGLLSDVDDPHYTVRAWRAVVTYLLRQEEFLYE